MDNGFPISLLLVNYKEFVSIFLDIPNWERLKSNSIGRYIENRVNIIQKQILLNGETSYWKFEQSLCILLRLSTCLNPYSDIRESISNSWQSIINSLNETWSIGSRRDEDPKKLLTEYNSTLFYTKIKDIHPDLLFSITLGGSCISIREAIKIFTSENSENNQHCLPCGRFISPEYLVPGTPGFFPNNKFYLDENETFWKDVFNTFHGRIPSVFRIVYILPEYAKALLKSYKINMEDQNFGALPLHYRHFIGILCSSLYDNDYMIKLEMQMYVFNNGPIEWLENPSDSLPVKFFALFEFLKCITFEPAYISNELMNHLIGEVSDTQVWTITELCHILCIVTTIQSISQLSCSFGITSMDHWELGPDPLEGPNCDGNTCYKPNPATMKDCFEYRKVISSNFFHENSNPDSLTTSYYKEILSEYIDVEKEEKNYTHRIKNNHSTSNTNKNMSMPKLSFLKLPIFSLNKIYNLRLFSQINSFIDLKWILDSTISAKLKRKQINEGKDYFNLDRTSLFSDSQIRSNEYLREYTQINTKNFNDNEKNLESEYHSKQKYEGEISTLIRIKDLLNHFPPQGDILGISKDEIPLFRSNSDKHKADRVLLSSVMNSKPKLQFNSLSGRFKHISNFIGAESPNLVLNKLESNKKFSFKDNEKTFEFRKNKKELKNGCLTNKNAHFMSMLNSFSIQMLEYEFYSETAWSVLSIYSGECSKCIKDELDILLYNCNKNITTICDIYKVPTTNPIRSSIWSYVFKLCGIVKFEMTELVHNSFLPLELKVLLKKTIRSPQRILRSDFERCRIVFSYTELIYYLIVVCKAKQAVTIICSIQSLSNILKGAQ
ncbi:Uncharacterized protein GY17_00002176 [Cryptosporidium hominis]|uniref:Uncharacterized protein n=1 Tax=Cryptosporidium hominis TaxID=237895 RepID=A0ABX5BDS4_CRYHO|nr:hypothetical protein [Cryptosporidium hominis TU502]PPS95114.1 Uncharacterized protein GY17_00002176 [Cryptosporidium hominis]|eukprot:PPS95114.1 Uncharacterized protein GY17_00002176 [Cryptosporidium hominis]